VEPIDLRVTAATLLAAREDPHAADTIARLLSVTEMDPIGAVQTRGEIGRFLESGDATFAAQLIHAATTRRRRTTRGEGS
jgi:hypothetical protein